LPNSISKYKFIRLDFNHKLKPFDCGDNEAGIDLTDFFINQSKDYLKQLLAVTYILETKNETIAYYSVMNDRIERTKKINKSIPNKKRYAAYPAVKIGRFGVDKDHQRENIGTQLFDYIKYSFTNNIKTGCRFITIDAYNEPNVLKFYEKNGFFYTDPEDELEETRSMYFDLMDYVLS
jgi:GNAT superfamily N-acetyltransferase